MITQEMLLQTFSYNDGKLYFKDGFDNQINKGDLAGGVNSAGYIIIRVGGDRYLAHRLIFLMFNGSLPSYVDHIDGNRLNNKKENLRECTRAQNSHNRVVNKNSGTKLKGVYWKKDVKKFAAKIQLNGNSIFIGTFNTIVEAKIAIMKKRDLLHGEFAKH